ncbi:UNVERIFIED_CONTAM: protein PSK SIMULATOR 1 [Sesamum radiatum]|uniref:Protein PSK SIMULATOR 1 n=1 Tax=Sesamum radiatum TaxID=300843 RepID=A0AAW2UAQ1_SESRA
MVAELWILKMGNQVSSNLKHALYLENSTKSSNKKQGAQERQAIGILSFEVANVMSKIIHLHKSLTDSEILKLKNEILKSEGIRTLVSSDEKQLLELALMEKFDDLNRVAGVVSRLGKKCTIPALQGFEHVYGDIVSGMIDIKELGFLVKDMESMVRKMERYVSSTASLYAEMEVMNELEVATKKFQQNQHEESRKAFEQKLTWQKQDVSHLKDVSLWNQTYDKIIELLARTVCTIYARMYVVFGDAYSRGDVSSASILGSQVGFSGSLLRVKQNSAQKSGQLDVGRGVQKDGSLTKSISSKHDGYYHSGPIVKEGLEKRTLSLRPKVGIQKNEGRLFRPEDFNFACGTGPGRMFMECLSLSSSASKVDDDDDHVSYDDQSSQVSGHFTVPSGAKREHPTLSGCFIHAIHSNPFNGDQRQLNGSLIDGSKFGPKSSLLVYAPPSTVGGSALALHYANVIIVLEKLLRCPHLVGDEARDDLYQMLPTSLRKTLKTSLKSYIKDLAIYDAPLAHDWRERLDVMLKWLAPLAHNMIRWQSERNFEQQQIVTRTNVLLLQTIYFADREKTEAYICELLVGLNYICRYEQQTNALLDCASSFDLEDCMEWQLQVGASFHP